MPRTVDASLTAALASGSFQTYFRLRIGENTIFSITDIFSFKLSPLELEIKFYSSSAISASPNSPQSHVFLDRGAVINGTPVYVSTSDLRTYSLFSNNGIYTLKAHVFQKTRLFSNIVAGGDTYQNVITNVCAQFGKTAVFKDTLAAYLAFQFFPTGTYVELSDVQKFFTLLRQKYFIYAVDKGSNQILFSSEISNSPNPADHTVVDILYNYDKTVEGRYLVAHDENGTQRLGGSIDTPIHNMGFLLSTNAFPSSSDSKVLGSKSSRLAPNLNYLSGDAFYISNIPRYNFHEVTEEFNQEQTPAWNIVLNDMPFYGNTSGGNTVPKVAEIGNYLELNTSNFDNVLSTSDTDNQQAFDTLDDHLVSDHPSASEEVQDIVGTMVTGNTETGIAVTYDDTNAKLNFVAEVTQAELDALAASAVLDGDTAAGVLSGTYPSPGFAVDMATQAELDAHINDTSAAHAASAISYAGGTGISSTDVEAALDELATEKANIADAVMDGDSAGGVLTGTYPNPSFASDMATQAELDAKVADAINDGTTTIAPSQNAVFDALALKANTASAVMDGDTAGGVLSGTYPSPSFAADMATQTELDAHINDTSAAHAASAVSVADAGGYFTGTDVEAVLAELAVKGVGHQMVALPLNFTHSGAYGSNTDLAANGGSIAIPFVLHQRMLLESVSVRNPNTATARTWGWNLYLQNTNTENAAENTLTQVAASSADETFTPGAASTRTITAGSEPVTLQAGFYWLVIQCRHATNNFRVAISAAGVSYLPNINQIKTTTNPNGSTLDFVAATWVKNNNIYAVWMNGEVFGQSNAW